MPDDKYPQKTSQVVGEPHEKKPTQDFANGTFEQPTFQPQQPGGLASRSVDSQPRYIPPMKPPVQLEKSPNSKKMKILVGLGVTVTGLVAGLVGFAQGIHAGTQSEQSPAVSHEVDVNTANQLLRAQVTDTVRHAVNAIAHDPAYGGTYEKSNDGFYLGNKPAFNAEKFAGKDKKFGTADDPLFTPSEIDVNYSQTDNKLYVLSAQETNRRKGEEYGDFTTQQITITPDGVLQNPEDIAKMLDEGTFTVERVAVEYPDGSDQVSTVLIRDSVTDKWTLAIAEDPKLSLTGEWTIKDLEDAVADEHDFFEGQTTVAHETEQQYPELAENARKIIDKADNNTTGQ